MGLRVHCGWAVYCIRWVGQGNPQREGAVTSELEGAES